ncbi:unnamed protein product, partial [Allacma fusca]
FQRLKEGL